MEVIIIQQQERLTHEGSKVFHKSGDQILHSFDIWEVDKLSVLTSISHGYALAAFWGEKVLVLPAAHPDFDIIYIDITNNFKINYKEYLASMECHKEKEFVLWRPTSG